MDIKIAVLSGDGIGEEVMAQALRVLKKIEEAFGHQFVIKNGLVGGAAYERYQSHLPEQTIELCQTSDAILFGSVGGPVSEQHLDKWKNCEINSILALRKIFKFYANLRPVRILPELADISPLKAEKIKNGIDLVIIRELLGDSYFAEHKMVTENGKRIASDVSIYNENQISTIAHTAFKLARQRRKKVTSVDKANVLAASKLWRAVVREVSEEYPDVELSDMLIDNCAMQLVVNPSQFDILVTTNMFGDILSDAAAVLPGSLGLLSSASLNGTGFGLYEPPGGSAPDIAGLGIANPIGQINSAAMLLRLSFGLENEARTIEQAVESTLVDGWRTSDIYRQDYKNTRLLNCKQMTDQILSGIDTFQKKVKNSNIV